MNQSSMHLMLQVMGKEPRAAESESQRRELEPEQVLRLLIHVQHLASQHRVPRRANARRDVVGPEQECTEQLGPILVGERLRVRIEETGGAIGGRIRGGV